MQWVRVKRMTAPFPGLESLIAGKNLFFSLKVHQTRLIKHKRNKFLENQLRSRYGWMVGWPVSTQSPLRAFYTSTHWEKYFYKWLLRKRNVSKLDHFDEPVYAEVPSGLAQRTSLFRTLEIFGKVSSLSGEVSGGCRSGGTLH